MVEYIDLKSQGGTRMAPKDRERLGYILVGLLCILGVVWLVRLIGPGKPAISRVADGIPVANKLQLLDNDPEYVRLKHLNEYDDGFIESLPSYQAAIERRNALIRSRVQAVSDPSLQQALTDEARKAVPEVDKGKFRDEARTLMKQQKDSYAALHKDDYFIVATYENYYPSTQKALFSLAKKFPDQQAESFVKANFGSPVPRYQGDWVDPESRQTYDLRGFGQKVDPYDRISYDRFKDDALEDCQAGSRPDFGGGSSTYCELALVLAITPQQMDAAYAAAGQMMAEQIQSLYDNEVRAGGDHSPTGAYYEYNPGWLLQIKGKVIAYVRRQSIWIVGRGGDPMR